MLSKQKDEAKVMGSMKVKVTGKNYSYHDEPIEQIYIKKALALIESQFDLPQDKHKDEIY